jgi:hypothetical protein
MSDQGQAAVEFAIAAGVLLIPVALAVTAFGPWSETRVIVDSVAAEAARAAVLALDHESGQAVVSTAARNYSIEPDEIRAGWCGAEPASPIAGACPLTRGGIVVIKVEIWTPLFQTPWGEIGGLWVSGDHSEPIDLYRSMG